MRVSPISATNFKGVKHVERIVPVVIDGMTQIGKETAEVKTGLPLLLGKVKNTYKKLMNFITRRQNFCIDNDATVISREIQIPQIRNKQNIVIVPKQVAGEFSMTDGARVRYYSPKENLTRVLVENKKGQPWAMVLYGGKQGTDPEEIKYISELAKDTLEKVKTGDLSIMSTDSVAKLFTRENA